MRVDVVNTIVASGFSERKIGSNLGVETRN